MKKALVLGVMAIFAINLMTVQTVNAQERGTTKPGKVTVNSKPTTIKAEDNTAKKEATTKTEFKVDKKDNKVQTKTMTTAPQGKRNANKVVSAKKADVVKGNAKVEKNGKAIGKDVKSATSDNKVLPATKHVNKTNAQKEDALLKMKPVDLKSQTTTKEADKNENNINKTKTNI